MVGCHLKQAVRAKSLNARCCEFTALFKQAARAKSLNARCYEFTALWIHSVLSVYHITFNGDPTLRTSIYEDYLPVIETALQPFGARPHWGKLATPRLYCYSGMQELYGTEALERFRALCRKHDPGGKFRNDFLEGCLFGKT